MSALPSQEQQACGAPTLARSILLGYRNTPMTGSNLLRRGNAHVGVYVYAAALAAAGVTCAVAGVLAWWFSLGPVDDAFISLRYAANWAAGDGLCFNPQERVEGYTNFLLVAIEAAAIRCGIDPVLAATAVGWCALFGLAFVFTLFVARHIFPGRVLLAATAGVAVSVNPVLLCWATSGLESCLYALLILLSVVTLLDPTKRSEPDSSTGCEKGLSHRQRTDLSAVCLILAGMTRPEAAALLPVLAVVVYLKYRPCAPAVTSPPVGDGLGEARQRVLRFVGIFTVGFGLYFTLRAMHFGQLFPNTFYAKVDYGGLLLLWRGVTYVWQFFLATLPMCTLALFSMVLIRGAPLWVKAFVLVVGGQLAVVVYEGGDHFMMYRFMVPVVPFLGGLALYPCVFLLKRQKLSHGGGLGITLFGLVMLGVSNVTVCAQYKEEGVDSPNQFGFFVGECSLARDWAIVGRWLRDNAPAGATVCGTAIGAIGYYSDLVIIDAHGIVDPVIAHQRRELGRGYIGHEKYDCDYVLSKRPSHILIYNMFTPTPLRKEFLEEAVWGDFNKELLRQPLLWKEYEFRSFRVGKRYFNLFVRRDLSGTDAASTPE